MCFISGTICPLFAAISHTLADLQYLLLDLLDLRRIQSIAPASSTRTRVVDLSPFLFKSPSALDHRYLLIRQIRLLSKFPGGILLVHLSGCLAYYPSSMASALHIGPSAARGGGMADYRTHYALAASFEEIVGRM